MALPDTTFNDLSQDEQKLAWAVYNKVTESSLDFDEQTLASSVDRVLMVNAAGTAAGTASLADLTTGLDGKYQSNLANIGDYLGVDVSKKRNLWDEEWEVGVILADGTNAIDRTRLRSTNYCECSSGWHYVVDPTGDRNIMVYYYDANKTYIGRSAWLMGNVEFPTGTRYFRLVIATAYGTTYNHDIAIIEGTSGEYVPYRKLITDEDVLTAEEISASTSLKSTDVASASAVAPIIDRYINFDWVANVDCNNFIVNGIYLLGFGIANCFTTEPWSPMLVMGNKNDTVRQIIVATDGFYVRCMQSNAWGNWIKVSF